MYRHTVEPGLKITKAAAELVALANDRQEVVVADFNDIELRVNPNSDPDRIVRDWNARHDVIVAEHLASVERAESRAREASESVAKLLAADRHMMAFRLLEPDDLVGLIDWLEVSLEIDQGHDRIPWNDVVNSLVSFGFKPNENTDIDFDSTSMENYARYLIGQFINTIQTPFEDRLDHDFGAMVQKWRDSFVPA